MATAPPREARDIKQIIRATEIKGIDRVHFLGPFADRINFAAQQSRALNLVYALVQGRRIDENSVVAVIGGGVAGITLTTALHLLGFTVHLFEARPAVLARQLNAKHRQLHPTVNQWPFDQTLLPTTTFPFFDWATDICSDVLSAMYDEWELLAGAELAKATPTRLHLRTEVTGRFPVGDQIALTTVPDRGLVPFDRVIYAVGFEDEAQISKRYPTYYWVEDSAEHERDNDPDKRFVISGIGDGGLIDAIRLSYRGPPVGVLALRIATILAKQASSATGCPTSAIVAEAETEYRLSRGDSVAGARLWEEYKRAASALPPAALEILQHYRVKLRTPAVYLVGRRATLVEGAAAPIHKLLATYSQMKASVRYIKGRARYPSGGKVVVTPDDPDESVPDPQPNVLITRHGAPNSLTKMFGARSQQLADLKGAQRALADDFAEPIAEALAKLGVESKLPISIGDRTSLAFRENRKAKLHGMLKVWPYLEKVSLNKKGFRVYTENINAWYPAQLFGFDVEAFEVKLEQEL